MSSPIEAQTLTAANKVKSGEVEGKTDGGAFTTRLGNSDIVADLEISVHLKIGENTELAQIGGASGGRLQSKSSHLTPSSTCDSIFEPETPKKGMQSRNVPIGFQNI